MDAEILAFRRLAEPLRAPGYLWWPALWSAMRALLEGRHDVAEERALAAYEIGEAPFPLAGRSSTCRSCCSSSAASRVGSTRWSRPPATTRPPMPTSPRSASRSRSCSPSSASSTRREPRWRRSTEPRSTGCTTATGPPRGSSSLAPRRSSATATSRRRFSNPRTVPTERCVQVSLATVCLGADRPGDRLAAATPSATSTPPTRLPIGGGAQRPDRRAKLARPDPGRPRAAAPRARPCRRPCRGRALARPGAGRATGDRAGHGRRPARPVHRARAQQDRPRSGGRGRCGSWRSPIGWRCSPTPVACATSRTCSPDRVEAVSVLELVDERAGQLRELVAPSRSTSGLAARSAIGSASSTPTRPPPMRSVTANAPRSFASSVRSSRRRWPGTSGSAAGPG